MTGPGVLPGNTSIRTQSGRMMDFAAPKAFMVCIEDIAHGLAQVCRFAGQTREFYSVAEHSMLVTALATLGKPASYEREELAMACLLHDASEAYMGDIATPLKRLLPGYRDIEARVQMAVEEAFEVQGIWVDEVRAADREALAIEAACFMPGYTRDYGAPSGRVVLHSGLSILDAEHYFIERFSAIQERRST